MASLLSQYMNPSPTALSILQTPKATTAAKTTTPASSGMSYRGVAITPGTDAQIAAQVAAIDKAQSATPTTPYTPPTSTTTSSSSSTGQTYTPAQYTQAVTDKLGSNLPAGSSVADIENAYKTGNWSGVTAVGGQPFSAADQQAALDTATSQTQPYYTAEQASDTESTANSLAGNQLDYNKTLTDNARQFQTDKTNQDQTAANNGVLFSSGRYKKLQALANSYQTNDAYNQAKYGQNMANTAGNYAYKYGSANAGNPTLSQYYQLGSQNYNPNVASGGVTPGGLSTIYNAGNYSYGGTETNAATAAAQTAAAGMLANKANKLVGGYNNSL